MEHTTCNYYQRILSSRRIEEVSIVHNHAHKMNAFIKLWNTIQVPKILTSKFKNCTDTRGMQGIIWGESDLAWWSTMIVDREQAMVAMLNTNSQHYVFILNTWNLWLQHTVLMPLFVYVHVFSWYSIIYSRQLGRVYMPCMDCINFCRRGKVIASDHF